MTVRRRYPAAQDRYQDSGPIQVSHIGHARNYLSADIIRRVMEDYFGFRIRMVMNVTDVDDKIILKARRQHLLQRYRDSKPHPTEVIFRCLYLEVELGPMMLLMVSRRPLPSGTLGRRC